ncbi:MAG: hypothetical protein IKJ35_02845 [Clostridia bacterium]|nr:hypothetical protein [Clostridia bacterium]
MEEKDYSFEEEKDPVTEENESTPIAEEPSSEPTEEMPTPPAKKLKRRRWVLPVVLGALLTAAALVTLFLFAPIALVDPFQNTFEEIFFDTEELRSLMNAYESKGEKVEMELFIPAELSDLAQDVSVKLDGVTVGKGKDERTSLTLTLASKKNDATYNLYVDDDIIALGGLSNEEDTFVSLPRKNIEKKANGSVFSPYGDSFYKFEKKEDYREFLDLLELFSTDLSSDEDAAVRAAIERILDVIEEEIETESKISFAEGRFALSKTVTYSLDSAAINRILDVIIYEAEHNRALNRMVSSSDGSENERTLADLCDALKVQLKRPSITFSYTVVGGKLTEITLGTRVKNEDDKYDKTELSVAFFYEKENLGFDFEVINSNDWEDGSLVQIERGIYRKMRYRGETVVTLTTNGKELIDGTVDSDSKSSSKLVLTYEDSGNWLLELSSEDDTIEIAGTLVLDTKKESLTFTLDKYFVGEEGTKADLFTLSVGTPKAGTQITRPGHKSIFEMDEAAFEEFFRSISLKKPLVVIDNWLGRAVFQNSVTMTVDGAPIWNAEAFETEANAYQAAYLKSLDWLQIPSYYIYSEEHDVYVLLSGYRMDFTYELTSEQKGTFKEAELKDGTIQIKK